MEELILILQKAVSSHTKMLGFYVRKEYMGNIDSNLYPNTTLFTNNIRIVPFNNGERLIYNITFSIYDKTFTDRNGNESILTEETVNSPQNLIDNVIIMEQPLYQMLDNTLQYAQHIVYFLIEETSDSGGRFYIKEDEITYTPITNQHIDNVMGCNVSLKLYAVNYAYCNAENYKKTN